MQLFPAIKLKMGNWDYYSVKNENVSGCVGNKFAEVTDDVTLDKHLQRELKEARVGPIMDYLRTTDERFFNSLVVAALGGNPDWIDIDMADNPELNVFQRQIVDTFGVLSFDDNLSYLL